MSMSTPATAPEPAPSAMPTMAVIFGITLISTGIFAYLDPDLFGAGKIVLNDGHVVHHNGVVLRESATPRAPTSLIPAGFGAVLLLAGIISIAAPNMRKHAMHGAAGAALLGMLGGLVPVMMRNNDSDEAAVVVGWILALCSLFFLALCVNSFVQARKDKERSGGMVA